MKIYLFFLILILVSCEKEKIIIENYDSVLEDKIKEYNAEFIVDSLFTTTYDYQVKLDTFKLYCDNGQYLSIKNTFKEDSLNFVLISNDDRDIIYKLIITNNQLENVKKGNIEYLIFKPKKINSLYTFLESKEGTVNSLGCSYEYTLIKGVYIQSE